MRRTDPELKRYTLFPSDTIKLLYCLHLLLNQVTEVYLSLETRSFTLGYREGHPSMECVSGESGSFYSALWAGLRPKSPRVAGAKAPDKSTVINLPNPTVGRPGPWVYKSRSPGHPKLIDTLTKLRVDE